MPQPNAPSNGHSDSAVCGVICTTGRNGEPLACGFTVGHEGDHSWASQPTWVDGIDPESVAAAAEWLAKQKVSPKAAKDQWTNAAAAIRHGLSEGLIRRKAGRPVMGEPDRTPNGQSVSGRNAALDAATLARCGYVPCFCPDDCRAETSENKARCPKHGTPEAQERWFARQRGRTAKIVDAYLEAT